MNQNKYYILSWNDDERVRYKDRGEYWISYCDIIWTDTYTNLCYEYLSVHESYVSHQSNKDQFRILSQDEFDIIWLMNL